MSRDARRSGRAWAPRVALGAVLLGLLAGCWEAHEPAPCCDAAAVGDAAAPDDAGVASDAAALPDAGVANDAATPDDAGDGGIVCAAGSEVRLSEDGLPRCVPCASGFTLEANAATCTPWTDCEPGEAVSVPGTSVADRQCAPCIDGYSTTTNASACAAWRDCPPGEYVTNTGTPSADRACASCPVGSTTTEPNQLVCDTAGLCPVGSEPDGELGCVACPAGAFCPGDTLGSACGATSETWDHDSDPATACMPWTPCDAWGAMAEGDAVTDRSCFAAPLWEWRDRKEYAYGTVSSMRFVGDEIVVASNFKGFFTTCGSHCAWKGRVARIGSSGTVWNLVDLGPGFHAWTLGQLDTDPAGNAYLPVSTYDEVNVLGWTLRYYHGAVVSYDPAGTLRWTRTYEWRPLRALALALAGPSGMMGAGQMTVELGGPGALIQALDDTGAPLNQQLLSGGSLDAASSIAPTAAGGFVAAGVVRGALAGHTGAGGVDVFLAGVTSEGSVAWTAQFGSAADDAVSRVIVLPDGSCVLVGSTRGALPGHASGGDSDGFLGWYDPASDVLTLRQFGGPEGEFVGDVAVDESGTLYVVGGALPFDAPTNPDAEGFLRAYAPGGELLWTRHVDPGPVTQVTAVVVDATRIAVGGSFDNGIVRGGERERDAFVSVYPRP